MNILICGASGFIGRAIAAALEVRGHRVLRGGRSASARPDFGASPGFSVHANSGPGPGPGPGEVSMDFTRDTAESVWLTRASARLGDAFPCTPWGTQALALLAQHNTADPAPFARLLGRPATAYSQLLATSAAP